MESKKSVNSNKNVVVTLNVGGTLFQVNAQTLSAPYGDGILHRMFGSSRGYSSKSCVCDEHGNVFICRDPCAFPAILSYLRTGYALIPEGVDMERVRLELNYFFGKPPRAFTCEMLRFKREDAFMEYACDVLAAKVRNGLLRLYMDVDEKAVMSQLTLWVDFVKRIIPISPQKHFVTLEPLRASELPRKWGGFVFHLKKTHDPNIPIMGIMGPTNNTLVYKDCWPALDYTSFNMNPHVRELLAYYFDYDGDVSVDYEKNDTTDTIRICVTYTRKPSFLQ